MKTLKFTIISAIALLITNISFAHHTIYPHSHEHAAESHSNTPGAIIFALIVIAGMLIFAKKYVQPKKENNK
jgi:membrane protein DedA with SNARE-associated domain